MICVKRFTFEAAHRLYQYDGPCGCLHGHHYVVEVSVQGEPTQDGMVLDFGVLSKQIGGWLNEHWDHATLLYRDDQAIEAIEQTTPHKLFACPWNPTAENMAHHLLRAVCPSLLPDHATVVRVELWETPTCRAVATI